MQHRYGSPNELTTTYHMQSVYNFFKEFLKEHYDQEVDETLEEFLIEEDVNNFLFIQSPGKDELSKLTKLARKHPAGALLASHAFLEKEVNSIVDSLPKHFVKRNIAERHYIQPYHFLHKIRGVIDLEVSREMMMKFRELTTSRNLISHGRKENMTIEEVIDDIEVIKNLILLFRKIPQKVEAWIKENPSSNEDSDRNTEIANAFHTVLEREFGRKLRQEEKENLSDTYMDHRRTLSKKDATKLDRDLLTSF